MTDTIKYVIIGSLVAAFLSLFAWIGGVKTDAQNKPSPAIIEKAATVKLSTGGAIEIIGIRHRGNQCYLLVGQSQNNWVFTRTELVCP